MIYLTLYFIMFISAEWTGFITPQNEYYNLFSSQSSGSVLLKMLLLVVMHTLALLPGDSTAVPAPGLGCVRVRTGWCLWEGDQGGTETDSFWIRTVILPYPAHALNRVLKQLWVGEHAEQHFPKHPAPLLLLATRIWWFSKHQLHLKHLT